MTSIIGNAVDAVRNKVLTKPREPEDWIIADEVEERAENENANIDEVAQLMRKIQKRNFDAHGHYYRGTHVKTLALVKGEMKVHPGVPAHLQQGIFRSGATYPVIARFANEPSFVMPDNTSAPRGLGMKVFGVTGDRLLPDPEQEGLETQDFLFNNAPMVELTDVKTTLEIQQLREKHFDDHAALNAELAKRSDRSKQFAPSMLPNTYLLGGTMYSQAAFAYGPYMAKYSLAPAGEEQTKLAGQTIPSDASATFHRYHTQSFLAKQPATYTFRVQFSSNSSTHPVEDASIPWDEVMAPWHDIATVTFPTQETFSDARRIWWEDKIALSPWVGVVDHKPLGGINRLRKRVYDEVKKGRARGNQTEVHFPKSADEMPE